jgi:hypothetical protein
LFVKSDIEAVNVQTSLQQQPSFPLNFLGMAMMATSSMLNLPVADDTMEISSDAGRADQDIDIDFMGSDHGDNDIDWMLDDVPAQPTQEHNDDFMYDDGDEITYVEEEAMQDDPPLRIEGPTDTVELDIDLDPHPVTEETLFDATENIDAQPEQAFDAHQEETLIDFDTYSNHDEQQFEEDQTVTEFDTVGALHSQVKATIEGQEQTGTEQAVTPDEKDVAQKDVPDDVGATSEQSPARPSSAADIHQDAEGYTDTVQEHEEDNQSQPRKTSSRDSSPRVTTENQQEAASETISSQQYVNSGPLSQALGTEIPDTVQQPITSSDTIHPITVYQVHKDVECSLFPTSESDDPNTYLLQDPLVASSTLIDFFRACRSVLYETVKDDKELEIFVDGLDLIISEVSAASSCHL